MADTVSVRFDDQSRERLETEAAARGIGIATFVRQLAEAELQRVRHERIRNEARAVTTYLAEHPTAFDDDDPSEWAVMRSKSQRHCYLISSDRESESSTAKVST